eukprot:Em0007g140a
MSWKERYSVSNRADYHNVTLEDTVPRHSAGNTSNGDKAVQPSAEPANPAEAEPDVEKATTIILQTLTTPEMLHPQKCSRYPQRTMKGKQI